MLSLYRWWLPTSAVGGKNDENKRRKIGNFVVANITLSLSSRTKNFSSLNATMLSSTQTTREWEIDRTTKRVKINSFFYSQLINKCVLQPASMHSHVLFDCRTYIFYDIHSYSIAIERTSRSRYPMFLQVVSHHASSSSSRYFNFVLKLHKKKKISHSTTIFRNCQFNFSTKSSPLIPQKQLRMFTRRIFRNAKWAWTACGWKRKNRNPSKYAKL